MLLLMGTCYSVLAQICRVVGVSSSGIWLLNTFFLYLSDCHTMNYILIIYHDASFTNEEKLLSQIATYRCFTVGPVIRGNRPSNHCWGARYEKLCGPIAPKKVKKYGNSNMWCVMNAISTTTVAVHPFCHKIIRAAVRVAIVLNNLARTE